MYQLLKLLNSETAHNIAKFAMKYKLLAPGKTDGAIFLFGKEIPCRIGLAAGFDKNADIIDQAPFYGFGWTEVGSVTRLGGIGNPRPRMFRIEKSNDIMNRMGLNGQPVFDLRLPKQEIELNYDVSLWDKYGYDPFSRIK